MGVPAFPLSPIGAHMAAIRAQPGPQEKFLQSSADITIYGGAAGGGKTYGLLIEPLYHTGVKGFSAVFFRRSTPEITNPGGLWDESVGIYGNMAHPRAHMLEWRWPSGAKVKMAHLERDVTVLDWQGAQIPLICWDQLEHFSRYQFFYMLSRNRSACGVKPYVRATVNPDADSWVAEFIAWWIDPDTGFPIPERAGVKRFFIRINDDLHWADSAEALVAKFGKQVGVDEISPKSVTFIPASVYDNKILMEADPGYLANLRSLPRVERERLLGGNWKIRSAPGLHFQQGWCEVVDAAPTDLEVVRYWDLAATPKTPENDPDWTVGVKLARCRSTRVFYVLHAVQMRETALKVRAAIKNTASADGYPCRIGLPKDPGQAGKAQAEDMVSGLAGYQVQADAETGDKVTRFGSFSAQAEAGNVKLLRAPWNQWLCSALERIPDGGLDHADACSGAMRLITGGGAVDYHTLTRR